MKAKWLLVLAVVVSVCGRGQAQPAYFEGTEHYYDLVIHLTGQFTWQQMKAEAESLTYLGVPGYLATVTSQEENQFIADTLLAPNPGVGGWVGGFQPPGTTDPSADWRWVTGESWAYTNWRPGEPNDGGNYGDEDTLAIHSGATTLGLWNDITSRVSSDRSWSTYVVEYPVPEPATLSLLALGGLGLVLRRWRKK